MKVAMAPNVAVIGLTITEILHFFNFKDVDRPYTILDFQELFRPWKSKMADDLHIENQNNAGSVMPLGSL